MNLYRLLLRLAPRRLRQKHGAEMEALFGHKVHLFLHVKVRENWADDPGYYREMGLEPPKRK